MEGHVYNVGKLSMADGLFHFLHSRGHADMETCVDNIAEIAKTGSDVKHPLHRLRDLSRLGIDLGLIQAAGDVFSLTAIGHQYVRLATAKWTINEQQGAFLGQLILDERLPNRTVYALTVLLPLLGAIGSASTEELMDAFTAAVEKSLIWATPITRRDKTRYVVTYWLELGYVLKRGDRYTLTSLGETARARLVTASATAGIATRREPVEIPHVEAAASIQARRAAANTSSACPGLQLTSPPARSSRRALSLRRFTAQHVDFAAREAQAKQLGLAGEHLVVQLEKNTLIRYGRHDLAERVVHVPSTHGDGAGYDVLSFTPEGERKYIEVKTTVGNARRPFNVTINESEFSKRHPDYYYLYRVYQLDRMSNSAKVFIQKGPLSENFRMEPIAFRARP